MVAITNIKKPTPTDLRNWWWWVKYLPWCCLSIWSVGCDPFLIPNKSNLDAVGRVVASGQPGMQPKQLILMRKAKREYIMGPGNLRLVWRGEVPKRVHAVNIGGRYEYTDRFEAYLWNNEEGGMVPIRHWTSISEGSAVLETHYEGLFKKNLPTSTSEWRKACCLFASHRSGFPRGM